MQGAGRGCAGAGGGWIEKVKSLVNFKNRTAGTMMEGFFHVVFQDRL